jgi:hypothetical protein
MTEPTPHILHESDVRDVVETEIDEHVGQPWTAEMIDARIAQFQPRTAATGDFTDAGSPTNTVNKLYGTCVFNITTLMPVWATGPAANDPWKTAAGVTAHTPD